MLIKLRICTNICNLLIQLLENIARGRVYVVLKNFNNNENLRVFDCFSEFRGAPTIYPNRGLTEVPFGGRKNRFRSATCLRRRDEQSPFRAVNPKDERSGRRASDMWQTIANDWLYQKPNKLRLVVVHCSRSVFSSLSKEIIDEQSVLRRNRETNLQRDPVNRGTSVAMKILRVETR